MVFLHVLFLSDEKSVANRLLVRISLLSGRASKFRNGSLFACFLLSYEKSAGICLLFASIFSVGTPTFEVIKSVWGVIKE